MKATTRHLMNSLRKCRLHSAMTNAARAGHLRRLRSLVGGRASLREVYLYDYRPAAKGGRRCSA